MSLYLPQIMSVLIAKSKENISSAQLLINNKCFASSIHCSYYSSVQIMIEILFTQYKFTRNTLLTTAKNESSGSHVFAINYLFKRMDEKSERLKAVDFNREVGKLKYKREHADYHETVIDELYSNDALKQAGVINKILIDVFKL